MGQGQQERRRKAKQEQERERQRAAVLPPPPHAWSVPRDCTAAVLDSPSTVVPGHKGSPRQLQGNENFEDTLPMKFLSLIILPDSIQTLEKFLAKYPLVKTVPVFKGKISIQAVTAHGRFLFLAIMAEISKKHSENTSWGGTFGIANFLIVEYEDYMKIKIQKEPVKVEGRARQLEARVKDLHRVAEIFISLYENDNGVLPVLFTQFKEDLEGATVQLVAEKWFIKYLRYHVAIMPSAGRRYIEMMLNCGDCNVLRSIMLSKAAAYPNDWKRLVKSTKGDSVTLLHDVFSHDNFPTEKRLDKYENTVRGLIRFRRNVLEHGKQYIRVVDNCELELYLAKMFGSFLPGLVRTLLQQGKMKKHFADVWSSFKAFKSDKWDP